ncbi:MarR family transcriptional regulator [Streptomyces acidiscabies]|uniref:MarR family transcriptional regulator n=1 Tax=Streptomyces acidiscabies TaxID=42234 RepID=UPI0038D47766
MANPKKIREALVGASEYIQVPHGLISDFSISSPARYLWAALEQLQGSSGSVAVSTYELAEIIGYSQHTVRRVVGELEEKGYLDVERRTKARSGYCVLNGGK